jgi:catechol 2,3-dioxygenase-like lactoylglutathione lyase family enzyme
MNAKPNLKKLHHVAWRCIDGEQTRHFYEDILGLPLAHIVMNDHVPSTGQYMPHCHLFFELADGSYIAFFDVQDEKGATHDMPHWVHHFAFEVDTPQEVLAMKERLENNGVEVIGIVDHHFVNSIYFFDPNGLRLEVTVRTAGDDYMSNAKLQARAALDKWTMAKRAAKEAGATR